MHPWLSKILSPLAGPFRRRQPDGIARMQIAAAWQSDFQPEDQFLVSFPRSGNTWLRHLLWELIVRRHPELPPPADLLALLPTVHHCVPVELQHGAFGLRGRIFKSHNIAGLAGQRMVYLVREPADTLVSYYHWCVRYAAMDGAPPVPQPLDAFCRSALDEWCEHLDLALAQHRAHPARTLFADYAALRDDTAGTLRSIAEFLGLDAGDALLSEAIERCNFEYLRAREGSSRPVDLDHPFFRKGRAGSGAEELQPATLDRIQRIGGPRYRQAAEIAATVVTAR